eukprot:6036845-Pleurochrysis_carterae.AAC.2
MAEGRRQLAGIAAMALALEKALALETARQEGVQDGYGAAASLARHNSGCDVDVMLRAILMLSGTAYGACAGVGEWRAREWRRRVACKGVVACAYDDDGPTKRRNTARSRMRRAG